jgi:hypothetical protein
MESSSMATTIAKPKLVSKKQYNVLAALTATRLAKVVENNGRKSVVLQTPTGKPVKDAPKLDREALERLQALGLVGENGQITPNGVAARKAAKAAANK